MDLRRLLLAAALAGAWAAAQAREVAMPIGKATVPAFSIDVPDEWEVVPGRARGDRWLLRDRATGKAVGRIDYKLASTDQKMMPEAHDERLRLGELEVHKFSVTFGPPPDDGRPPRITRSTPLITRYDIASGPLQGLFVMTESYTRASGLEARLEGMLASVRPR